MEFEGRASWIGWYEVKSRVAVESNSRLTSPAIARHHRWILRDDRRHRQEIAPQNVRPGMRDIRTPGGQPLLFSHGSGTRLRNGSRSGYRLHAVVPVWEKVDAGLRH